MALLLSLILGAHAPGLVAQSIECSTATVQAKAPKGTTITGAVVVPAEG